MSRGVLAKVVPVLLAVSAAVGLVPVSQGFDGPDDPAAVEAAARAVERLGSGRGGLLVTGSAVGIVGLQSVGYGGGALELSRDLADLGAKSSDMEVEVTLSGDVLFDFDSWEVKPEAGATLEKLARGIRELGWRRVVIEGHTDSLGSDEYNLELSRKRAIAIKEWFLTESGLDGVEYETVGYGESRPIAPNTNPDGSDNPEGRAKNRRVEIRILK